MHARFIRKASGCIGLFVAGLLSAQGQAPPAVIGSSVLDNDVIPVGDLWYTAQFDRDLDGTLLGAEDVLLTGQAGGPQVPGLFSYDVASDTLTVRYLGLPEDVYTLVLRSGDGAFEGADGQDLDGEPGSFPSGDGSPGGDFVVQFSADLSTNAFPTPLVLVPPAGSQVYRGSVEGLMSTTNDTDTFTLIIDAGVGLSIEVWPESTLDPRLVVQTADGGTVTASGQGTGQMVGFGDFTGTAGLHTITVLPETATTGRYTLRITLNASYEAEWLQSNLLNNDIPNAEPAGASFLSPFGYGSDVILGQVERKVEGGIGLDDSGYGGLPETHPFEDISLSGTAFSLDNGTLDDGVDGLTQADLQGFTYPFYGTGYTNLFISSNGLITFGTGIPDFANTDLGTSPLPATIAVLWDDLVLAGSPNTVYWEVRGRGSEDERLIVQWNAVRYYGGSDPITFQAVLRSVNGDISCVYPDIHGGVATGDGASATVGIKGPGSQGGDRLVAAFNDGPNAFVGSGGAVRFGQNIGEPPPDWYTVRIFPDDPFSLFLAPVTPGNLSVQFFDNAGMILGLGSPTENGGLALVDYIHLPSEGLYGDYAIRVRGNPGVEYALINLWGAQFDQGGNGTLTSAQPLPASTNVLGNVGDATGNFYSFPVEAGGDIRLETQTPASGGGTFVNTFDPMLRLYNPDGVLIATDDDSGIGLNSRISSNAVFPGGWYTVQINGFNGTTGEFVLGATGTSSNPPVPSIVTLAPEANTSLGGFPGEITVRFSQPLLLSTIHASDLLFRGLPAISVRLEAPDRLVFSTDPTAYTGDGLYEVRVNGGEVSNLQRQGNIAFTGGYLLDSSGPIVTGSTWTTGGLPLPQPARFPVAPLSALIHFNEDLLPVEPHDIELVEQFSGTTNHPFSISQSFITSSSVGLSFPAPAEGRYTLRLKAGDGVFEDTLGNDLDGEPLGAQPDGTPSGNGISGGDFTVIFETDLPTRMFPVPLQSRIPPGSLVYDGQTNGVLGLSTDIDGFTIDLQAGQTLTAIARPSGGLQPSAMLRDPDGSVIGSSTGSGPGEVSVLQTIAISTSGVYRVDVSATGGTFGTFNLQLVLNAVCEDESLGGAGNDSLAAAQDISAGMLTAGAFSLIQRTAVLGMMEGTADDWYRFDASAGHTAYLTLVGEAAGTLALEVADGAATILATGTATGAVTSSISSFFIPTTDAYFVRVRGTPMPYSLVVTLNAAFELEPNASFAQAQPLEGMMPFVVFGHVLPSGPEDTADWFALPLTRGQVVEVSTSTPLDDPLRQIGNGMNPALALHGPAGSPLAEDGDSGFDGKNAYLQYVATSSGTHAIRVWNQGAVPGEYLLVANGFINHDVDGDGLLNDWELDHLLDPNDDGSILPENGAGGDPDGDGYTNAQEQKAGTHPRDPHSWFQALSTHWHPLSPGVGIIFPTMPDRFYIIEFSDAQAPAPLPTLWLPFANPAQGFGSWLETGTQPGSYLFMDDFTPLTSGYPPPSDIRYYRIVIP